MVRTCSSMRIPRKGFQPDWKTYLFNYGRKRSPQFSVLKRDVLAGQVSCRRITGGRRGFHALPRLFAQGGEWLANQYGGRENLEAIDFLRQLNQEAYAEQSDVQTFAEESTSWPMVSRPLYVGGLGFGLKWDMGWMHDTLEYFHYDPIYRKYHHDKLTFRMLYGFTENFVLPLSHDEVVHGKGSLIGKMPGDEWQKFANLRLLYGYMYAQPGKKLLFMGGEFGQVREWAHDSSPGVAFVAVPGAQRITKMGGTVEPDLSGIPGVARARYRPSWFRVD
mgnify:CR=1 FL=1